MKKDEEDKSGAKDFDVETLSIEDARKFQQLVENTPPDQLDLLKKMLRHENAIIAQHVPVAKETHQEEPAEGEDHSLCPTPPEAVVIDEQSQESSAAAS